MSQHACITLDVPPADHFSALYRSGILCIAPPLKVLYMNVDARDVILRYNRSLKEECKTILRGEILAFCLELLERLRRYHHVKHFALFEVHRRIEFPANAILLRGLAIPKPSGLLQSRMCVL